MFKSFVQDMHHFLPSAPKKRMTRKMLSEKLVKYASKIIENAPKNADYVGFLKDIVASINTTPLIDNIRVAVDITETYQADAPKKIQKYMQKLSDVLFPYTEKLPAELSAAEKRMARVLDCPLFEQTQTQDKRAFQYGPACAVAKRERQRFLVYYPLGSGKTLAALHAARTFLEMKPKGKIIIITTLSNVETTWSANIQLYLKHVPDKNKRIKNAMVHNIDWWFTQDNKKVKYYNRVIRTLEQDPSLSRQALIEMTPRQLRREASRCKGKCKKENAIAQTRQLLNNLTPSQKGQSMLQATVPEGPFCLIVDECQQYINASARTLLVNTLADASYVTLLLTATPLNDSNQWSGLMRMLRTPRFASIKESVLWTDDTSEKPIVNEWPMRRIRMTDDEWQDHKIAEAARTSWQQSQNAYLNKTRQACNCISKWEQMASQLDVDCARFAENNGPIRMIVYSFFLDAGVEGFFVYLAKRHSGRVSQRKLRYNTRGIPTTVSLMNEDTLDWFNQTEDVQDCKILLLTSRSGTGISLKNVRAVHIMEPQWSIADENQAIGRATRKGSHDLVPAVVEVTRWMAIPPASVIGKKTAGQKVNARMLDKKKETDKALAKLEQYGKTNLKNILLEFRRN